MKHEMPQLPYPLDALAPKMSAETLEYHYGRHLKTYLENLNRLIAGTPYEDLPLDEIVKTAHGTIYNNAAQAWNHTFFFDNLTPEPQTMSSNLCNLLCNSFGSVEKFKEELYAASLAFFGSGWIWITLDKENKIGIQTTANAGNPLTEGLRPLMVIDLWEHAYYIDYRNRRADYLDAVWELTNWERIEERMETTLFNLF